jgi:hypothetical protein
MADGSKQQRLMGDILADIDALPLSRDPVQQLTEIQALNRLLSEAEYDAGPGTRNDELRQHPEAARVFLGVLDRMYPLFNDAELSWAKQHSTRQLLPPGYYQVDDLLGYLLGEYLPGLPGYAEALVELVQRNPQAWSVEALVEWVRRHPGGLVNGADPCNLLERLAEMERPESVRRFARTFIATRPLAEHFRALGAPDPWSWARSQVEEGIPQYARFVFLRQAWTNVIADGNTSWIDGLTQQSDRRPLDPGAGAGPALRRMLAAGASREDIAEVVRVMQWQVLANLVYQLEDPSVVEYPSPELPRVHWTLFEVDDHGKPLHPIRGLHESILYTDPSGRQMRPRNLGTTD